MGQTLDQVYKVGLNLFMPVSLEETYATIVKEAMQLSGGDTASILLKKNGSLKKEYSSIQQLYKIQPRKRGVFYNIFKTNEPLIFDASISAPFHPEINRLHIAHTAAIPLVNEHGSIGLLAINFHKNNQQYKEQNVDALKLFAAIANMSIRKAKLYDAVKNDLKKRELFMSLTAHEIRNPLTTIYGYTHLLYKKYAQTKAPSSLWIRDLSLEVDRLSQLTDEFLQTRTPRFDTTTSIKKKYPLYELARRAINDFTFNHPTHQIEFSHTIKTYNPYGLGDIDKLLQAIINVLNNAAKYSPSGSKIILSIKEEPSYYVFSIKDHGIGILKKDLNHIFEKFFQGDSTMPGLGLGLYLTKTIIEKNMGSIAVSSKPKKGTAVEIRLPKLKREQQ